MNKLRSMLHLLLNFSIISLFFAEQAFSAQYLGPEYYEDPKDGSVMGPILGISYLILAIWLYNQSSINKISKQHPILATILFIFVFPVIWVYLIAQLK
jgi:putative effector of murein hydrolase